MARELGIARDQVGKEIYSYERSGVIITGDANIHTEEAFYEQQERNLRLDILFAVISGIFFLFSLFGAWA